MIHGMWCGGWCWDHYKAFFEAAGYRCVATTLPYHDENSRTHPDARLGTSSLLDDVDFLEQQIRALPEKPVIMGHSMGGLLAQMLAARGLAEAVVLLCPAPPAGIFGTTPSVFRCFWNVLKLRGFWRRPVSPSFDDVVYGSLHLMPEADRKQVFERLVHESGRKIFEIGFWPFDGRRASRVDETRVKCPMLVVGAGQDRLTPASVVRRVARKYRHVAEYREFPDHAHWVLGEPGWEEIAGSINAWLASTLPKREP